MMTSPPHDLRRTPLHSRHAARGARFVPFAGFEMPVQYTGVIEEHHAVRRTAGVFDVSHMGELVVRGPGALDAVNRLVSNDLARVSAGRAQYTLLLDDDGGIIDDLIAYRVSDDEIFLCVNAATREGDRAWLADRLDPGVTLEDESDGWAQLAVQGPAAAALVARALDAEALRGLRPFRFVDVPFAGVTVRAATTGYTGSGGYELYAPAEVAETLWDRLFEVAAPAELEPVGLGARDTLRLEMGYCLYGADIDRTTTPLEAGLDWVVRLDKPSFVGSDALRAQRARGVTRRLAGVGLEGRAIARAGFEVFSPGTEGRIGHVTSGTRSPSLGRPIALAMLDVAHATIGAPLQIDVRGRRVDARVEALPFYRPEPAE